MALAEIQELLGGVSRTRATEVTNYKTFPAPLAVVASGRVRVWSREQVAAWIRKHRPHQHSNADDLAE